MCGFPLTRSDRRRHRHHHCCVILRPAIRRSTTTTIPPVKRVTRSPQRNLTHNTHTNAQYSHVADVRRTFIHIHTHIKTHAYKFIHRIIYSSPASRPRRRHQGSLYCVIGISRPSSHRPTVVCCPPPVPTFSVLDYESTVTKCMSVCVYELDVYAYLCAVTTVYTNVYNRVLPGTCSRCVYA